MGIQYVFDYLQSKSYPIWFHVKKVYYNTYFFFQGRTVDLKTLTLIEDTTPVAANNNDQNQTEEDLDKAEEDFEKLLAEAGE